MKRTILIPKYSKEWPRTQRFSPPTQPGYEGINYQRSYNWDREGQIQVKKEAVAQTRVVITYIVNVIYCMVIMTA